MLMELCTPSTWQPEKSANTWNLVQLSRLKITPQEYGFPQTQSKRYVMHRHNPGRKRRYFTNQARY